MYRIIINISAVFTLLLFGCAATSVEKRQSPRLYQDDEIMIMIPDAQGINNNNAAIPSAQPWKTFAAGEMRPSIRKAMMNEGIAVDRLIELERSGINNLRWIRWQLSPSFDIVATISRQERGIPNLTLLSVEDDCAALIVLKKH